MNFGEVIQNWKEGVNWIDGIINPYVMRDMTGVSLNPVVPGEVFVKFSIVDRTYLVNGEVDEYKKELIYQTFCLKGTAEEKAREAARLQNELKDFTSSAIAERQEQIDNYRKKGEDLLTTNPYAW